MNDVLNPFESAATKEPLDLEWAAKRKLADACRRMISALCTSSGDAIMINDIADRVNQQAELLENCPRYFGRWAFAQAAEARFGNVASISYELSPLGGLANPIAPPIKVWLDGDKAYGSCLMDWQYEGPPRSVHGGFVIALFDQFLGVAQTLTDQPGFTGTLTTKFLQLTPLCEELTLCGEVVKIEGRKTVLRGEMRAGSALTAVCEGTFIRPRCSSSDLI